MSSRRRRVSLEAPSEPGGGNLKEGFGFGFGLGLGLGIGLDLGLGLELG